MQCPDENKTQVGEQSHLQEGTKQITCDQKL